MRKTNRFHSKNNHGGRRCKVLDDESLDRILKEEIRRLREAAEAGDTRAMSELGERLGDTEEAMKWRLRAAEAGETLSMNALAGYFYFGFGGKRDLVESAKWYRRSAEAGNGLAAYELARFYAHGLGVERNLEEAMKMYRLAVTRGIPYAFPS